MNPIAALRTTYNSNAPFFFENLTPGAQNADTACVLSEPVLYQLPRLGSVREYFLQYWRYVRT
jgi:hypothetical protein